MELNEDRRKKLEAGKEKLAAFRKKKAKRKKTEAEKQPALEEIIEPLNGKDLSPPQFPSLNDVNYDQEDSDQFFISSGDEFSSEEPESRSSVYYQAKLADARQKISELEETVEGKQLALDLMTREQELSKTNQSLPDDNEEIDDNGLMPPYLEKALAQRDELITQLTESLQSSTNASAGESEMLEQIQSLSQQVLMLQDQLQESDEYVEEQNMLRDMSSSILQTAKTQMLQLQSIVKDKDNDICTLSEQMKLCQDDIERLANEKENIMKDLSQKNNELNDSSKKLEDSQNLDLLRNHSQEQEKALQDELASKSEEVNSLIEAEQYAKAEAEELREENRVKDEKLQALIVQLDDMEAMRTEMENESQELMKENKELNAHRQNLSASLSDHNELADNFEKLTQSHEALSAEHDTLKSKCTLLENVVDELKHEKSSSESQLKNLKKELEEENQRHSKLEKDLLDMESRQSTNSDQLNNKLNDLQNRLSTSEEALSVAEKTLKNEKDEVANLQSQLNDQLSKHSELISQIYDKDVEIAELGKLNFEYKDMIDTLQGKETNSEKEKEELLKRSSEFEKHLEEVKAENKMLSDQAVQMKEDLVSAQYVHSVELSEKDHRDNLLEEQMELMNEELTAAKKRTVELENKMKDKENDLVAESEKRKALQVQLKELEGERDTLRETIQDLNVDVGRLKEELIVETKSPVEEKIMAFENKQLSATLKKNENEIEEKVQLTILEEEIISLNSKLDEQESMCHNLEDKLYTCQYDHKAEVDKHKSEILRLDKELKSQCSENDLLGEKLAAMKSTLDKTKNELSCLDESHNAAKQEFEEMRGEKLCLETKKEELLARVKELEDEAEDLKSTCQELQNKEKELLERHNELQAQFEVTVGECQKLQELSQEREIKMQNLLDGLEEKETKLNSLEISHKEELSSMKSDLETWKQKFSEEKETKQSLQTQLSDVGNELESKAAELSEILNKVDEKESVIRELEQQLSDVDLKVGSITSESTKSKEEVSHLLSKLGQSQDDTESAKAEIEHIKTSLDRELQEKASILDKMDSNDKQLMGTIQLKEEIEQQVQDLHTQLESKQSDLDELASSNEELNTLISDLELKCTEVNNHLCREQLEKLALSESLKKIQLEGKRLEGLMAAMTEELQEKEGILVIQTTRLIDNESEIVQMNECLKEKDSAMATLEKTYADTLKDKEKLTTNNNLLTDENQCVKEQIQKLEDKALIYEQDVVQLSQENNKLQEQINQAKQENEGLDNRIHDLTQDNEMQTKEVSDMKSEIEERDLNIRNLGTELDALQTAIDTSEEEKKLLKVNFDACMDDMQQKAAEQEAESRRMKCQLAEESRSLSKDQIEMKEMFELQLSQLEEKIMSAEREKIKLEKEISEAHEKADLMKESYENQLSEIELSLQAANSECLRLNESKVKAHENFENEIADLKSMHEMQRSELIDNNMSLEKVIDDLQRTLNDNSEKAYVERGELEQSFEVQMLELDEKRRNSESEVGRLRRHLDEMKKDHEMDLQNLEKRYETQLFELEDKCSIMGAELNRARKSMVSFEGDFGEERQALEVRVEDLENMRRELEIKVSVLEDDLTNLKGESQRREEEMKSILKNAAEKQRNMATEIDCLAEEVSTLKSEKESSLESLKKKYESTVEDLETRNKHLEGKILSLQMHFEEDLALRNKEPTEIENEKVLISRIAELKEQVGSLSDENMSLKRRLLSHKSSEKKILLAAAVEDICPSHPSEVETHSHGIPKLITSTPSKGFGSEDSFSPTDEEVSLIEGFVAERDKPVFSSMNMQSIDEDRVGEPDFVAEEHDHFQPEMVIEKVMQSSEHGTRQLNMHPICEEVIADGFQPELRDHFLMETIEEPNNAWQSDLTVGASPTMENKQKFNFTNIPSDPKENIERSSNLDSMQEPSFETFDRNSNCLVEETNPDEPQEGEEAMVTAKEMERKLADLKERLEEEYVTQMRAQKRDLVVDYETKKDEYEREMEQHVTQKAQSIKNDWERKFAKALQKVRKDVERRHLKELRQARLGHAPKTGGGDEVREEQRNPRPGDDGMPDIAEGSEELDQKVQQLSRENQELAEARDELLKQIEISQTWGLHHRVQHELQSKISGRDSPVSQLSPTHTLRNESPTMEESPSITPSRTPTAASPVQEEITVPVEAALSSSAMREDADCVDSKTTNGPSAESIPSEAGSFQTEFSETSSARERFLEEFTDISQQSSQDLPLEWELTTTMADAGEFERDPQTGSVWEVFDARCLRQDCQEVRQGYRRLLQFLVKCNVDWEDLLSEESGLLPPPCSVDSFDDNNDGFFVQFNPALTDIFNYASEEGASALNVALRCEGEPFQEDLSAEHLRRDLYETLNENDKLRIMLATEGKVRQQLEKKISVQTVDMEIQVGTFEKQSEQPSNSFETVCTCTCSNKVQSLNLVVLEKEHALVKLEAELASLKSINNDGSEVEIGKLSLLKDEVKNLQKEVQFKDRVINNLREDLNRLIYPKLPPYDNIETDLTEGSIQEHSLIDEVNVSSNESSVTEENQQTQGKQEDTDVSGSKYDNSVLKIEDSNEDSSLSTPIEKADHLVMNSYPLSEEGEEAKIAAGEDLAFGTRQDFESATEQGEKLSLWIGDESIVLEGPNLGGHESLKGGSIEGSVVSSSSSSTLPSQLSTPTYSKGKVSPASELQDKVLAEELNKLRRDLQKTREIYSKENSLLQEALHKDKMAKEFVECRRKGSDLDSGEFGLSESQTDSNRTAPEDEATTLRQRLTICLEQNKMLEAENTSLRARIREQDAVVLIIKQKLLEKERSSEEWRKSMSHQLQCLQQQRDDLLEMLKNIEDGASPKISEVMGQTALREDSLRRVQENLMEKMEELDHLHQMLTQRQIELQHCEAERRHLEQLCLLKDQTEMQLMKQKRLMEEQVTEIELRLRERETSLVEEKTRLLHELREKDQHLSQMSPSARSSPILFNIHSTRSSSLGDLNTGLFETFSSSRRHTSSEAQVNNLSSDEADRQHMEAIEKLKQKLKLEYDLRAARMAESQASAISSYWQRHGKSS